MSDWGIPSRQLRCQKCGEVIGRASLLPNGNLLVADRAEHEARRVSGAELLAHAKEVAAECAKASQVIALDLTRRDLDRARWSADLESAESSTRAALDEVKRLRSTADEVTFELRCRGGHTPRISAVRLGAELRDAPDGPLTLA